MQRRKNHQNLWAQTTNECTIHSVTMFFVEGLQLQQTNRPAMMKIKESQKVPRQPQNMHGIEVLIVQSIYHGT